MPVLWLGYFQLSFVAVKYVFFKKQHKDVCRGFQNVSEQVCQTTVQRKGIEMDGKSVRKELQPTLGLCISGFTAEFVSSQT